MTYKINITSFCTTVDLNQAREIFDSTWSKDFGTEITLILCALCALVKDCQNNGKVIFYFWPESANLYNR
jgi:hypothetical protein